MGTRNNFDSILDECLERVVFRGESIEKAVQDYPSEAEALQPLLKTALALKKTAGVTPDPAYRARARYEFQRELQRPETARHGFLLSFRPRWSLALPAILAILLAGSGAVVAASGSMPDSALYGVKRATEQARLAMTFSEEARTELYTEFVDKRIGELVYVAERGDVEKTGELSRDVSESMTKLDAIVLAAYGNKEPGNFTLLTPLNDASRPQSNEIGTSLPKLAAPATGNSPSGGGVTQGGTGNGNGGEKTVYPASGEAGPTAIPTAPPAPLAAAPPALTVSAGENTTIGPDTTENAGAVKMESAAELKLKNTLITYAEKHPAQLRVALERVPEAARQDILRAIAVTAAGYEQALRILEQP